MKITLIRHAQVEEAYLGCYNGHIDIALSQHGYLQARELKKIFKSCEYDAFFCSDLLRAKETLKEFIDAEVSYTSALREKSWGRHEGLSFEKILAQDEIEYVEFEQFIRELDGESIDEFSTRVREFFFSELAKLTKKSVLVMTHSGVIKLFISIVKNIPLKEAFSISIPYASYIVYDDVTKKIEVFK